MQRLSGKQVSDEAEDLLMHRYRCDEYVALTSAEVKSKLAQFGVCVIPRLLNKDECAAMERGAWTWLEDATQHLPIPVKKDAPETWKSYFELLPSHAMLLQHWGIGQARWLWEVRSNRKVMQVFASLWNTSLDDLITSFDGAAIHLPHEVTRRGFYRGNTWLHTDQSYGRPNMECVQSWVTARKVRAGDATLAVIPGSHQLHGAFASRFGPAVVQSRDWFKLNEEQQRWYEDQTGAVRQFIKCPRGSMVLWDSRLIHSGSEAMRTRPLANIRTVAFVCMTPRRLASDKMLKKRVAAFEAGRTSSHWPHKLHVFGKLPRTYGNPVPRVFIGAPHIPSGVERRLVGYCK
jgi:hypothetical protein